MNWILIHEFYCFKVNVISYLGFVTGCESLHENVRVLLVLLFYHADVAALGFMGVVAEESAREGERERVGNRVHVYAQAIHLPLHIVVITSTLKVCYAMHQKQRKK